MCLIMNIATINDHVNLMGEQHFLEWLLVAWQQLTLFLVASQLLLFSGRQCLFCGCDAREDGWKRSAWLRGCEGMDVVTPGTLVEWLLIRDLLLSNVSEICKYIYIYTYTYIYIHIYIYITTGVPMNIYEPTRMRWDSRDGWYVHLCSIPFWWDWVEHVLLNSPETDSISSLVRWMLSSEGLGNLPSRWFHIWLPVHLFLVSPSHSA